VKYAITYFPDASIFDGRPTEGQETYADYCAAAGWEFISAYGAMQFFRSTRLNPTPIETDEREKLTAIHRSMMKTNILSYGALAAVWILNLVMRLGTWTKRPLELLSSNLNLGLLLIMSSLVIYCLALLCDYVYWYHGSKKAVEQGGNCLQPHTKGRLWLGNVLLVACALSALTFIGDVTSPGKGLIWAYSFGGMAVLMVVCHGTLALMKRKGVDRDITRFVFFALAVVMSIAYASAMVPLTLRIRDAGLMEEPEKQPEKTGPEPERPPEWWELTDAQWERAAPLLSAGQPGGRYKSDRQMLNALLYREYTNCPWRELPREFGAWRTVHERYSRWKREGILERVFSILKECGAVSEEKYRLGRRDDWEESIREWWEVTDEQWERLRPLFPPEDLSKRGRKPASNRQVLNAILCRYYNATPWLELPRKYGPWRTVIQHYMKWRDDGTLDRVFGELGHK